MMVKLYRPAPDGCPAFGEAEPKGMTFEPPFYNPSIWTS
jgi:hypothetical protein